MPPIITHVLSLALCLCLQYSYSFRSPTQSYRRELFGLHLFDIFKAKNPGSQARLTSKKESDRQLQKALAEKKDTKVDSIGCVEDSLYSHSVFFCTHRDTNSKRSQISKTEIG